MSPRISLRLVRRAAPSLIGAALAIVAAVSHAQRPALAEPSVMRQLAGRVTLAWGGQTLGAALERLADVQQTPLWIDRRVDTSADVELTVDDESVQAVLDRLAAPQDLVAVPFRTVVYFGPRQTADELATLAIRARESLAAAPAAVRAKWLQSTAWSYPRLAQPRALVEGLASSVGATVSDAQLVPLDLWPARSLPALAVVDRMVLVLAGFDLTAEMSADGRRLRVAPVARPVEITRQYSVPRGRQAAFAAAAAGLPADKIERRGAHAEVAARWEDHERLRSAIRGESSVEPSPRHEAKPRRGGGKSQTFTLKIANQPVDRVIEQIAGKTGLTVQWASPPPQGPAGLASCDVREVSLDELLSAILAPMGLAAQRDEATVTIHAAR